MSKPSFSHTSSEYKALQQKIKDIDSVLGDAPGYFYIKNVKGEFLYLNRNMRIDAGCGGGFELLGKTDAAAPWAEYEEYYKKNDEHVTAKKITVKIKEVFKTHDRKAVIVSTHKKPFYCENKLVGVIGNSLDTMTDIQAKLLFSEDINFVDIRKHVYLLLTGRQKEILFWSLQGCSSQQIAARLGISKRTIEHHLYAIKDKNEYTSLKDILLDVRAV